MGDSLDWHFLDLVLEVPKRIAQTREVQADSGSDDRGNPTINFHGERRSNATHQSATDPDARLARKGPGKATTLSYQANALMDNRYGLVVATQVEHATGYAERDAALAMVTGFPPTTRRRTLGADKGYDVAEFVHALRTLGITPHVAQHTTRTSGIDGRTTRHPGMRSVKSGANASKKASAGARPWASCASSGTAASRWWTGSSPSPWRCMI